MSAPLVIAHGAANDAAALARADGHADLVEADVRRYHGRLEVRHAKSLGPLPIFWDDGRLLDPCRRSPRLDEALALVDPGTGLVLDLKGPDPRLPAEMLAATAAWRAARPLHACARSWRSADRLRGAPGVVVLHSVGGAGGLRALLRRYPAGSLEGVSIHRRLLTPGVAGALRERAPLLWTWPVDDPWTGAALARWGVTGLISDAPERLAALRAPTAT